MDPLSNPLILSNIFEQLPHDGKKSFREVSPLWEDSTLQSWRNNALVKIVKEQLETNPNSSLNSLTSKSTGITLQEFVELLKTQTKPYRFSETKPFRSFQLEKFHFRCPPYKTKEAELEDKDVSGTLVESLFEKVGPTIHHLHLELSGTIRTKRIVDALKWILLKVCVNLKELHFDPIISSDQSKPVSQPVEFVQEKALNLVSLKLAYYPSVLRWTAEESRELWNIIPNLKNFELNISGSLELIKQLKHPLDSGKFIKLERVHLNRLAFTNKETMNDLAQIVDLTHYITAAKPPLTKVYLSLDLDLRNLRNAQDSFKAFLKSCKDTLTSLSVLFNENKGITNQSEPNEWIVELSGVPLPNLNSLWLQYENYETFEQFNGDALKSGPKNFDFGALQGFPKLKKLTVQLYGDEKIKNELPCGKWLRKGKLQYGNADEEQLGDDYLVRNELLEDFNFWSYQKFDCDSLKKLASWMPSIKCLGVVADEITLPVILTSFLELKRLSLLDGSSVSGDTLEEVNKTYPGIEINMLDFDQSSTKCEMPEYF